MWKVREIRAIGFSIVMVVALSQFGTAAAGPRAQSEGEPLVVATMPNPPFVITGGERITGYSIDLWEEIAQQSGLAYEYVVADTVEDQLQMVADGKADLAIGAISMNSEREDSLDFSHPYYTSGQQIMTPYGRGQVANNLLTIALSPAARQTVLGFVAIMFIIGNLMWLSERKKNSEQFPQSYFKGVWEGMWWAIVTVATVGYGDKVPRTAIGRLLGMVTILLGLLLIADFIAAITSQLTLEATRSPISSVEDLLGKRVLTVADSAAAQYLTENFIRFSTTETIDEAVEQLADDQADAIVYDAPILQHLAVTEGRGEVQVAGPLLQPETLGIAFPLGSPHRKTINKALLDAVQNGAYAEISQKWFGE